MAIRWKLGILLCSSVVFTQCQKEVCDFPEAGPPLPATYPIPGGWEGKFGRGTDPETIHFAAFFKTDQRITVEAEDQPVLLTGTWELKEDSIIAWYSVPGQPDQFRFAAQYSDTSNRLEGYWMGVPPTPGGGNFFLVRD